MELYSMQVRGVRTLALASRAASASAAMARCNWTGSRTSLLEKVTNKQVRFDRRKPIDRLLFKTYISTLSTLTPHGSVASSKLVCMMCEMVSLSERISARFFVPKTFRSVVAANRRVEWLFRGEEDKETSRVSYSCNWMNKLAKYFFRASLKNGFSFRQKNVRTSMVYAEWYCFFLQCTS